MKTGGAGIEPANSGFADRDLTTWLPRRVMEEMSVTREQNLSTRRGAVSMRNGVME